MIQNNSLESLVDDVERWIRSFDGAAIDDVPVSSSDSAEDEFNSLAREVFTWQFANNQAYRDFCRNRDCTPDRIEGWRDIPTVTTSAFKTLPLTTLAPEQRTKVFHSSGTSEASVSRHFHSNLTLSLYNTSALTWFRRHLLGDAQRFPMVILTPPPDAAPTSSLVHMLGAVAQEHAAEANPFYGFCDQAGRWEVDQQRLFRALEQLEHSDEPVFLLGTAFSLVHVMDSLHEHHRRFHLPPQSRIMETGGYKGRSRTLASVELYRSLSHCFGIPPTHIVSEYGMCELNSQAYDHVIGEDPPTAECTLRLPPWTRWRIVSPETDCEAQPGEIGLIEIFDLANVGSVMAIQTQDLGQSTPDGIQLLGRAATAAPKGCSLMTA